MRPPASALSLLAALAAFALPAAPARAGAPAEGSWWSLNGGYYIGDTDFGGNEEHDLAALNLAWQRGLTGNLFSGSFFQGRAVVVVEAQLQWQVEPKSAVLGGVQPLVRWQWTSGEGLQPFFEAGIGAALTNIGTPDLSTGFQFTDVVGFGAELWRGENSAWILRYRFQHISNGDLREPNAGVNAHGLFVGYAWR